MENNEHLDVYLRTIAHELKHPLSAIHGFVSLLGERYGKELPNEGKHYIDRINSNVRRAEDLLSDIVRLARVRLNDKDFKKVPSRSIIESAVETLAYQLSENNISLSIGPDLPEVLCDAGAITIVFTNLISNAIKYSKQSVEHRIEVGCRTDEIFYKFYIKDNGIGFKSQDRSRVFQLFSRLRTRRQIEGTGLGLTIVKGIVEAHGGEIWVESRMHRGATFFFTLPKPA
jgi:signal transduction histidine kinase